MKHFPTRPRIAIITHGFKTTHFNTFLRVKDGLLNIHDPKYRFDKVIVVDWRDISGTRTDMSMGYKVAAKNAEVVGKEVAYLLEVLRIHKGLEGRDVHLIGFSLGAQVSSFASRIASNFYRVSKIGRITGLDPAGPKFNELNLNRDDATFVDVIHTNAGRLIFGKFGQARAIGHSDFFPNGGEKQPGMRATHSLQSINQSVF